MIGRKSRQHNPSGVQSQALPDLCRPREEGRQKPYVAVLLSASEEKLIRELERRRVGDVECPFRFLALETTEVVEMSGLLGILPNVMQGCTALDRFTSSPCTRLPCPTS